MTDTQHATHKRPAILHHFLAGAVGGSAAAAILNPLDIVRTRMQSAEGAKLRVGPINVLRTIVRNEGILSLYRGLVPTILGVGPTRALYFGSYSWTKHMLSAPGRPEAHRQFTWGPALSGAPLHLLSAGLAGIFTNTVMCPWWVVRVRLQLQTNPMRLQDSAATMFLRQAKARLGFMSTKSGADIALNAPVETPSPVTRHDNGPKPYKGIVDCAVRMYREEGGMRSLFRGLTASYLGVIETALQFAFYGWAKERVIEHNMNARIREGANPASITRQQCYDDSSAFLTSAVTKLVASAATYPHEVLRTRMREQRSPLSGASASSAKYRGLLQAASLIIREEGARGLYGGMSVHLLRTVPNAAILLVVVEKLVGGDV